MTSCRFKICLGVFLAALPAFIPATAPARDEPLLHWTFPAAVEPSEERIELDATGGAHLGELMRGSFRRPFPSRIADGAHGASSGAVRLEREGQVQSLTPVTLPEHWTLTFWMRDERRARDIADTFSLADLLSIERRWLGLGPLWRFRPDSGNEGVDLEWFRGEGIEDWEPVQVPAFLRETQFGSYLGYGWYANRFFVPADRAGRPQELHFGAVDEQAWVYVNGRLVGEQTTTSTGLGVGDLWNRPFSVSVEPGVFEPDAWNLLIVRTHASAGNAGIYLPVTFQPPEAERVHADLGALRGERAAGGQWEHVALSVTPETARLYLDGREAAVADASGWAPRIDRAHFVFAQDARATGFAGAIDDVRVFAQALPEAAVAALSGARHTPDADWLDAFAPAMQPLIAAGGLSHERTDDLVALGAPDSAALIETFRTAASLSPRLDALWALSVVGDDPALDTLIGLIETGDPVLVTAATDGLERLHAAGVFPARVQERADPATLTLLERAMRLTTDPALQQMAAVALRATIGDLATLTVMVEKFESPESDLSASAAQGLLFLEAEGGFSAVLAALGDARALQLLGRVLRLAEADELIAAGLGALRAIDSEPARRTLVKAFEQGNWQVRRQAALVLREIPDLELTDALLDWPAWQYDAGRTATPPWSLAETLHLHWERQLPPPQRAWPHQWDDQGKLDFDVGFTPVTLGERLFLPSSATDSLTAYALADGTELWRFYADGPIRLAPAAWRDRVFCVSDDGRLYSLDAETGALHWSFRGAPDDHHLLGNERVINLSPARGAPLVHADTVYFTAGIWPLHGIFIYALDAETGELRWVNDTTSSDYVPLPHGGAYGFGGLAPQGYLALDGDRLIVSGGRGVAATFDRHTGAVLDMNPRFGSKGSGGYAVHGGGMGLLEDAMLSGRLAAVRDRIEGEVHYALAARGRLVVSTTDGRLYAFGPASSAAPRRHAFQPEPLPPVAGDWDGMAGELLERLGETGGYALVLGAGSGDLVRTLLNRSALHLVVVESDPARVRVLRDTFAAAGLYGSRVAVIEAQPAEFRVRPYLFSLVVSENAAAAGLDPERIGAVLDRLRPYGGLAWLGVPEAEAPAWRTAAEAADVDRVTVEARNRHLFAHRDGPLTGAGAWTHQYHDGANTLLARDDRVRLPLGVLWYGGPNNHDILPRHAGGPRPHVVGGRQIYLGVDNVAARCVYTGRRLWHRDFPGLGHPFTNLELEAQWADGDSVYMTNIPGATYIGSPFVSLSDGIYLRYGGKIHRLDPVTGETLAQFDLPGPTPAELNDDPRAPDWGHVSISGDVLVTTTQPHLFEDQRLGWLGSYSGTSSRRLMGLDRFSGEVLWQRDARIGFRHMAIVSSADTLFAIDGLSENALQHLARRARLPETPSDLLAIDLRSGDVRWRTDSNVYGTYLMYLAEHDMLIEGGSVDMRRPFEDEPRQITARRGTGGDILWEGGQFTLPAVARGDMLIPGRPGEALNLLTGERWIPDGPRNADPWNYTRAYGCGTLNASEHLLLYRSGYAGFFDLEHESGTGTLSGFRAGCSANLLPADGVLNALDYTRSCTCSYGIQTSLALVHLPDDPHIEFWTVLEAAPPDPAGFGLNFGAPGRRVDPRNGRVWFNREGTHRRHSSAVLANGETPGWVAASVLEGETDETPIIIGNLQEAVYAVRLHFAELDADVAPADRVFDLYVNGEPQVRGLDVTARAGGAFRPIAIDFHQRVGADGRLEIALRKAQGSHRNPILNGIELEIARNP